MPPIGRIDTPQNEPAPVVNPRTPPTQVPSGGATDYEKDLMKWVIMAVREGEALLQLEGQSEDVDSNIAIALGEMNKANAKDAPFFHNNYTLNRIGKNINDLASSITDFRPIGQFRTYNKLYETQGQILDKLMTAWWYNMDVDLKIQLLAKQSLVARTAYAHVIFNPALHNGLGDIDIIIRDYRDVLPIRPNSKVSIQDAVGVVIKSKNTVNWGRSRYPDKAHLIIANSEGGVAASWAAKAQVTSPQLDHLDRGASKKKTDFAIPTYDHYEIYINDGSINNSKQRKWVGPGPEDENPWGYWVEPGKALYPNKRLIVIANLHTVLYDGGSPYWHGMFPVIKLTLDPWPMSFLGKSAMVDAKPAFKLQSEILQGIVDAARKAVKPGIVADRSAVNRRILDKFDSSEPGYKLITNPTAGQGVVFEPPPQLPQYVEDVYNKAEQHTDYVMGVLDMRALSQLKALNAEMDVEQLLENLGPSIRTKGRVLEVFLRELGFMMRGNFFQFYPVARRVEILGPDGMEFEDFDYDPGTLIPMFAPQELGDEASRFYNEDSTPKTRAERAREHIKSFTYYITPNSLLSLAKTQDKLLYLQLARIGYIDMITLLEKLDVPNIGDVSDMPKDIIGRMAWAAQQGLVGAVSAAGRHASGQQMPQMRSDGNISESG
jgi:hypothetical protein